MSLNSLETALLVTLRDSLRWESSVAPIAAEGTYSGNLTAPSTESQPFSAVDYQRRDRELAWLDTRTAAAVVEVSLEIGDVWNAAAVRPRMEGPEVGHLDYSPQDTSASGLLGRVTHVKHVSIPINALSTDCDLAGRDILIYETLCNAVKGLFVPPPIVSSGAAITPITAWSFAQGTAVQRDINPNLALNRDLFKVPDMNLAERDNQMAGYVAQLCQVLKNPFNFADRLYVAVYGIDGREAETYTLTAQLFHAGGVYLDGDEVVREGTYYRVRTGVGATTDVPWTSPSTWEVVTELKRRVWTCEPALWGRNRFVYDTQTQLLQWFRESATLEHVPQLVALSIPGIFSGQTLSVLAKIPERKDGQFWRNKAAHVVPAGDSLLDLYSLPAVANSVSNGFLIETACATLPVPGIASVCFQDPYVPVYPTSVAAGRYRVSALVEPSAVAEIAGAKNDQGISGDLGGATFSGYSQITYSVALPPTQWTVELDYSNYSGSTSGFHMMVQLDGVTIFEDTAPLYFSDANGDPLSNGTVVTSSVFPLFPTGGHQTLSVNWTGGGGQLHIRAIRFKSSAYDFGHYRIIARMAGQAGTVDVVGQNAVPGVMNWNFALPTTSATDLVLTYADSAELPLRVMRMDMGTVVTNAATPSAQGYENYRQDCLVRAVRSAGQAFKEAFYAGGVSGTFLSAGALWDSDATERWMSLIETSEPRLRALDNVDAASIIPGGHYYVFSGSAIYEGQGYATGDYFTGNIDSGYVWAVAGVVNQVGAWVQSKATHNGRPALAPRGLFFDYSAGTASALYQPGQTVPELVTLQPWMIELGIYASQPEFWLPLNV